MGGFRYIHRDEKGDEAFDIEPCLLRKLSVIQDFNVTEGRINNQDTSDVVLPRKWSDTVSGMGSDIRTIEDLRRFSRRILENGATPDNYEHLDFPLLTGTRQPWFYTPSGSVNLTVAYAHIFQEDRAYLRSLEKGFNNARCHSVRMAVMVSRALWQMQENFKLFPNVVARPRGQVF